MKPHAGTTQVAHHDLVIHLTTAELEQRIEAAVTRAIDGQAPRPDYLDRAALARALHCSVATVSRLRASGCPCVIVGDSPRFRLADVQKWLEERAKDAAP